MTTLLQPDLPNSPDPPRPREPEVVIREARRRQHHRWLATAAVLLSMIGLIVGLMFSIGSRHPKHLSPSTKAAAPSPATTTPPPSPWTSPLRPGPLAIAPNGGLYVSDQMASEIFELLPGGKFEVVAGTARRDMPVTAGQRPVPN